ncbi:MAG: AMP-binding protein [Bacteroidetes bacterium]|nr:AMP-binding protein [Bacteroidota bacterium]
MKGFNGNNPDFSGTDNRMAIKLLNRLAKIPGRLPPHEKWKIISERILTPDIPFHIHKALFDLIYAKYPPHKPPLAWLPDEKQIKKTNIHKALKELNLKDYPSLYRWSVTNRLLFWEYVIKKSGIRIMSPYTSVALFNDGAENPQWLYGAKMNIAQSCFGVTEKKTAIIFRGETGPLKKMSYGELNRLSNRVANGLVEMGFKKGDALAIDMLMTAEAVAVYIGIIKAGCIVVSIADSLAPAEIQKRLEISGAKAIFTQDFITRGGGNLPMYEKVLQALPQKVIVIPSGKEIAIKIRDEDVSWKNFLSRKAKFVPVACDPEDTINILFSSGTTGDPKAIPWNHTTPIKCVADGYFHHNIQPGRVIAWPTNLGWMMGPWLIFASLINKAAIALFYGAPTGREFGEFVQDARVNMLGVVPSIVKRWIETDCMEGLDWSKIYAFSSTGESSNFNDYLWLMARAGYKPVIEYCGGTEIGGGYITGTMVQSASPATFSTPSLGLDLSILDEEGREADNGELFVVGPSIGLSTELLNQGHHKVYYSGTPPVTAGMKGVSGISLSKQLEKLKLEPVLRRHGDQMEKLRGGYFRAHGRADDTMNLGGIKISSAEIERTLLHVEEVSETAAIGVDPPGGGPSELVIYAVMKTPCPKETLVQKMQKFIREKLNPLFKIKDVVITGQLPRTASNKVMRRVLRKEYLSKYVRIS